MEKVLLYTKINVAVKDRDTGELLFEDSNLFLDEGRAVIASIFQGTLGIDKTKYVCDLGDGAGTPAANDLDLDNYLGDGYSIAVNEPAYPTALSGEGTGVHFQFVYAAAGDTTIRELGLFLRPSSDSFPDRNSGDGEAGYILARLVTTYSSIFVGSGKTITIDWKIIF